MPHISHLTCVYPPYKGGIGSVTQKYAQIGINNGYNVSIYTPNYQKTGHIQEKNGQMIIHRIQPQLALGNAAIINIKNYLKNTDILHIHYPFYGSLIPAIRQIKKNKKPIVLSWHMNPQSRGLKGLFFKLYKLIITPWIFKQADKILVSTEDYFFQENLFQKYKNKIEELPFGINTEKFKPQTKNIHLLQKYNLQNKKILIFVGGLDRAHYFKGVNILLKAFSKLSTAYSLIIVGAGELKDAYQQQAEKLKISERLIFTGGINDEDLIKHYNLADCLLLPSINGGEAFGIVQLEAMACGKPVIVSDLPGVRTVLSPQSHRKSGTSGIPSAGENNQTGLIFETKNSKDLKNKITELFNNPKKLKSFSQNARQRVIKKYSDKIISKKLIQIYQSIIPNNYSP